MSEQLSWIGKRFNGKQVKEWIEFGFQSSDYDFVVYLNEKDYKPQSTLNLEKLRKEYDESTQSWLDKKYPRESRSERGEIYLNEPNLEGELNLADFINSKWIYVSYPQCRRWKSRYVTTATSWICEKVRRLHWDP